MAGNDKEPMDNERNTESIYGRLQPSPPERSDSLSMDEILDVLADDRCRHILDYLRGTPHGVVSRGELASFIESQAPDGASEEWIAIALHHTFLPKLDDMGLLDYDQQSATIEYLVHPRVERYLDEISKWGSFGGR